MLIVVVGMGTGFPACTSQRPTSSSSPPESEPRVRRREALPPAFADPFIPSLADAQELLKRHPNSAIAYYELGRVYHAKREYEKAIPLLERSLEFEPLLLHAYVGLSDCYRYKQPPDWQKGEEVLLRLQSLAYGSRYRYLAQMELGNFYLDRHTALKDVSDLEKAECAYRRALKEFPNSQSSNTAYGIGTVYARRRDWKQAKIWFEKAVEWAKESRHKARALEALANVYAELGDQRKANELIEEAKRAHPNYPARLWAPSEE